MHSQLRLEFESQDFLVQLPVLALGALHDLVNENDEYWPSKDDNIDEPINLRKERHEFPDRNEKEDDLKHKTNSANHNPLRIPEWIEFEDTPRSRVKRHRAGNYAEKAQKG